MAAAASAARAALAGGGDAAAAAAAAAAVDAVEALWSARARARQLQQHASQLYQQQLQVQQDSRPPPPQQQQFQQQQGTSLGRLFPEGDHLPLHRHHRDGSSALDELRHIEWVLRLREARAKKAARSK